MQLFNGDDIGCVEIPTIQDMGDEGNEQFIVSARVISQDSSRVILSISSATVIIEDDDVVGKTLLINDDV